jgi:hypothetical protein
MEIRPRRLSKPSGTEVTFEIGRPPKDGETVLWEVIPPLDLAEDASVPVVNRDLKGASVRIPQDAPAGDYQVVALILGPENKVIERGRAMLQVEGEGNGHQAAPPPPFPEEGDDEDRPPRKNGVVTVQMKRTRKETTPDTILGSYIRSTTSLLSFDRYKKFMDRVVRLSSSQMPDPLAQEALDRADDDVDSLLKGFLPGLDPYTLIKKATDAYLVVHSGVLPSGKQSDLKQPGPGAVWRQGPPGPVERIRQTRTTQ